MRRVFALASLSTRIKRVYVYQWKEWKADRQAVWDSALVSSRGTPRPSFDVFATDARLSTAKQTNSRRSLIRGARSDADAPRGRQPG